MESATQAIDNSEVIGVLGFNMNYFSFHLLDYLVIRFDMVEVKVKMQTYQDHMEQMRKHTLVSNFYKAQPLCSFDSPPIFQKVVFKFKLLESMTVEELEYFEQSYVDHYGLQRHAMMLADVDFSSLSVGWFIHKFVINELKVREKMPIQIFEKHSIIELKIDASHFKVSLIIIIVIMPLHLLNKHRLFLHPY